MAYPKGELLAEGKTKRIWNVADSSDVVIVENKSDITAFDDPSRTRTFSTKAEYATTTTCRVFELLADAGIPVAYREQISPTEFAARNCMMIPIEAVVRRFAVGSYLTRNPDLKPAKNQTPYRFHRLVEEFFLKTTKGQLLGHAGEVLVKGLNPDNGEEDPLILDYQAQEWQLFHSKKPAWDPQANLHRLVKKDDVFGTYRKDIDTEMEDILAKVFLVLEGAWNTLGLRLIDMKIEFGLYHGDLLVADVIDNDSWRLRDADWQELSKESFRQGEELGKVEEKYGIVARLSERFRIPSQALVLWRGSEKDEFPKLPDGCNGVDLIPITMSAHKSTRMCLDELDEIFANFPDGGVIIAKVGRSNGLGPILAARSVWPVIAIPATLSDNPEDVWSSVRMPSDVPLLTAWPEGNAVLAAMNFLAAKNPVVYMIRQRQIETLDY